MRTLPDFGAFSWPRGLRPGAADVDALAGEVDVAPPQREQLALAEAGHRGGEVQGGVQLVAGARARAPRSRRRRT